MEIWFFLFSNVIFLLRIIFCSSIILSAQVVFLFCGINDEHKETLVENEHVDF